MLFAGWEVRIVKNCDRGLENAALGLQPRAAFSRSWLQFFTIRPPSRQLTYILQIKEGVISLALCITAH